MEVPWVEVKPKVGRALFWYNINEDGEVDMKTLHAGATVTEGTKYGLNIWTRQRSWRDFYQRF
jgi:prolyl 4-hydroxylase